MEPRTQRLLELHKILSRLEANASCVLGQVRARQLQPAVAAGEVRRRLVETTQARTFLAAGKNPPFGGIGDISQPLQSAAIGSALEPAALLAVGHFAAGARRLREVVLRAEELEIHVLQRYAQDIVARPDLEKAIFDAIDQGTGEIKDDASLALLKARRNMRRVQADIQSRLRQMLGDANLQPLLQDQFVTVRDGRYCLPVKAECRGRVPGIVHDRSASGGAFFVEPQAVVDLNNRLRELTIEEREAIVEILTNLTHRVAAARADLAASMEAAGALDFAFAKGRLSLAGNGCAPHIEESDGRSGYCLLQARHPLVEGCVANDISLGDGSAVGEREDFDVMLITGPNTGGKTIVLKTLGLHTCMAACGLHLPVLAGSWLSIPGQVFADIGDEQSIEQSLSTFSSHLKQIVHILQNARAGDLVLLDELGAGTDPDEGASLAKAVLRTLQRRGVRVVATTHYGELKQFALSAARFENASVEFDSASLRPTYHLRIGIAGASNAFEIAARLGMPPEIVQRARRYLGRDRAEADAASARLEEAQRELEQQTAQAGAEHAVAAQLRQDYEARLERAQAEIEREREAARGEAEATVRAAQEEADAILRELRGAGRESKQTESARHRLRTLRDQTRAQVRPGTAGNRPSAATPSFDAGFKIDSSFPGVGDFVKVASLNKEGTLLSSPDDSGRVTVRVGAVRVQVGAYDIEALPQPKSTVGGVTAIRIRKAVTVPEQINLIGKTTDEALPELEKYLDDALLAEAERVRVVHGRGTGALRTAVHKRLKAHRAVREFHLAEQGEGGEGATIVELA